MWVFILRCSALTGSLRVPAKLRLDVQFEPRLNQELGIYRREPTDVSQTHRSPRSVNIKRDL